MVLKRIAMIEDSTVTNIVLWDGLTKWEVPSTVTLLDVTDMECDIGMSYTEDGTLVDSNNDGILEAKPSLFKRIASWFTVG